MRAHCEVKLTQEEEMKGWALVLFWYERVKSPGYAQGLYCCRLATLPAVCSTGCVAYPFRQWPIVMETR